MRTGGDEAEATGGDLVNLETGNAGSVAEQAGASLTKKRAHPLLGEVCARTKSG